MTSSHSLSNNLKKINRIGLSSDNIVFDKKGGVQQLNTKKNTWWICSVQLNGTNLLTNPSAKYVRDEYQRIIEVETDSFLIKKTDLGLRIKVYSTKNEKYRIIDITLQNNNYFDYITVRQK